MPCCGGARNSVTAGQNRGMKIALCNEVLQPLPFERQCALAAALGYDGLEVAPFTLAEDPTRIDDVRARGFARIAQDHGLAITGLHWLLVAPAGLSIVSDDRGLRERTAGVMERLVELCAAMGGSYLVHGSPKQRSVPAGATPQQAWERARDALARAARSAQACGVTYCIEPLSPRETDLVNTVEEGVRLVREVGSPALKTMIDCSAAGQAEREPVHALMERWMPTGLIGHVQVNDPNRQGPGQGELRFEPILRTLRAMQRQGHYGDVIAVEPFDYRPDGPGCAARAIGYLRGVLEGVDHG
jgi:sugar phosphate isomerase/epimerase